MKVSLVITTFNRDHLLLPCLQSIKSQAYNNLEVVIVNDGFPGATEEIARQFGTVYIFTGHRNIRTEGEYWRGPAPALNTGVRKARGEIVILSCAEIFHVGKAINKLVGPLKEDPKALCVPHGWDATWRFTDRLLWARDLNNRFRKDCKKLDTNLPFLLALRREHFLQIGGYDEDFAVGYAWDDNDFVDRIQAYGCHFVQTLAQCIHLYHSRALPTKCQPWRFKHNKELYHQRKGVIVRNEGRNWGSADRDCGESIPREAGKGRFPPFPAP